MSDDFKPVGPSVSDMQRANDNSWDAGEFRHTDAYPARHMNLHEIKNSHYPGSVAEHHPKGTGTPIGAKETAAIKAGKRKPYLPKKTEASIKHMNDNELSINPAAETGDAIHLPRTRKRTWKNGTWS